MATETTLTRVNVFPSETSYNSNKSSLANTELSLVKLESGFGSDIASKSFKEDSGYIKFENGMMICYAQGKRKGTNGKYTFPAAFFDVPAVVCNPQQWYVLGDNHSSYRTPYIGVKNITNTGFEVDSNSIPSTYIAIGLWEGTPAPHPDGVKITFNRHQGHYSIGQSVGNFTVAYTDESGNAKTITNPISLWVRYGTTITISNPNSHDWDYQYFVRLYDKDGNQLGEDINSAHTMTRTITEDTIFQIIAYYEFDDDSGGA